jgi:drug/metabolite transporter (DMT)-like permease
VCYTACNYGFIEAIKTGSITFTTLLLQLSFICVPIWGFFFWDTKFTPFVWIGFALVAASLALCLYKGKEKDSKYSWKWLLYALLAFIGNAGCSIIQRTQQINCNGQYGSFFMVLSMGISSVIGIIICLQSKGFSNKQILRKKWYFPVLAGVFNALQHVVIIYLVNTPLSPSLIYPSTAVGGLIVTTIFSTIVFKEKMRLWQWIGVVLGAAAIGVLTL